MIIQAGKHPGTYAHRQASTQTHLAEVCSPNGDLIGRSRAQIEGATPTVIGRNHQREARGAVLGRDAMPTKDIGDGTDEYLVGIGWGGIRV